MVQGVTSKSRSACLCCAPKVVQGWPSRAMAQRYKQLLSLLIQIQAVRGPRTTAVYVLRLGRRVTCHVAVYGRRFRWAVLCCLVAAESYSVVETGIGRVGRPNKELHDTQWLGTASPRACQAAPAENSATANAVFEKDTSQLYTP